MRPGTARSATPDVTLSETLMDIPDVPPLSSSLTSDVMPSTQALYDPLVNTVLNERYRLEKRLGEGGMGIVYLARHVVIDKPVAIKLLRSECTSDSALVTRFVLEARAATQIGHPNIVDVTDFGTHNGQSYFVMEFLAGATLASEIETRGAIPPGRAMRIVKQICHALAAAHKKGIVHRDLKPENIFLVEHQHKSDVVKVLDFGVAKMAEGPRLTRVGSLFGTPEHMSPEQARGEDVDARSDIYSLGVIFYEMLTGQVPFSSETVMGTISKHLYTAPRPLREIRADIPAALEALTLKALQKDRLLRPQTMDEFVAALALWEVDELGVTLPPAAASIRRASRRSSGAELQTTPRRRRVWAFIAAAAVTGLVTAWTVWQLKKPVAEKVAVPTGPTPSLPTPLPVSSPTPPDDELADVPGVSTPVAKDRPAGRSSGDPRRSMTSTTDKPIDAIPPPRSRRLPRSDEPPRLEDIQDPFTQPR